MVKFLEIMRMVATVSLCASSATLILASAMGKALKPTTIQANVAVALMWCAILIWRD